MTRDRVKPYVIRTAKRQAIDVQGKPLFQPRQTQLIAIAWQAKHYEQQRLYEAVTEYAREGYNQAVKQKKNYVDTVEYRVREVLEQKLEIILKEFGVDKTGDVLDSAQAGEIFDELFVEAMMNPTAILFQRGYANEEKVTATVAEVRSQAQLAKESSILYDTTEPLDPDLARQLLEHPLHHWVELIDLSEI